MKSAGVRTPSPKAQAETETETRQRASKGPELTGGPFDFFRKYQRPILYTAGIFALVSFSISGALLGFFDKLFQSGSSGPALTLGDGRRVHVLEEDYAVARDIFNHGLGWTVVLPPLGSGGKNEVEQLAMLRRLAIAHGFEASSEEVEKAIAQAAKVTGMSLPELAGRYTSVEGYRRAVAEALRVSNYVRLQALSADITDAALVQHLLEQKEMLTLTIAALSKKALEDQVEKQEIGDEELKKWLAELPEAEKAPFQDENRVALTAVGLVYDKFDATRFADELKGVEITDEQIQQRYAVDKDRLYRREPPPGTGSGDGKDQQPAGSGDGKDKPGGSGGGDDKPAGSGDGKAPPAKESAQQNDKPGQLEQQGGAPSTEQGSGGRKGGPRVDAQESPPAGNEQQTEPGKGEPKPEQPPEAEQAKAGADAAAQDQAQGPTAPPGALPQADDPYVPLDQVKDEIRRKLQAEAVLKAAMVQVQQEMAAWMREAVDARNQAAQQLAEARKQRDEAQKKVDATSNDETKKSLEEATAAFETRDKALKAADEAVTARRKEFDLQAAFEKVMNGRPGLAVVRVPQPKPAAELRELGELGTWMETYHATSMNSAGELGTTVQRTPKAAFHFKIDEVEPRPLRPWEEIEEQVRTAHLNKRVDQLAKEKIEAFEARRLELAKEARKDEVAKLEEEKHVTATQRLEAWRKETGASLEAARKNLQALAKDAGTKIHATWAARVAALEKELQEQAAEREQEIRKKLDDEYEKKIKDLARKAYADVLARAAEGTGFEVREVGPYATDIRTLPRYDLRYPEDVRFLFRNDTVTGLAEGEATDVLDDLAGRAVYVAVAKSRAKPTLDSISRRELLAARASFQDERLVETVAQSFTREALEMRYGIEGAPKITDAPKDAPKR